MEFAICFKGFVQPDRAKALVRLAERWIHILLVLR